MGGDLSNLEKMAEIFAHPLKLVVRAGKNLIVNGIDIFKKVDAAMIAYHNDDYYEFGSEIGQAIVEVFLKAAQIKKQMDENAYYFMSGFLSEVQYNVDHEQLYNHIDGLGIMVFGPVKGAIKTIQSFDKSPLDATKLGM